MKVISRGGKILEQTVEETIKGNSVDMLQTPSEIMMELGSEKAKYLEENLAAIPDCAKSAVAGCQGTLTNLSYQIDATQIYTK